MKHAIARLLRRMRLLSFDVLSRIRADYPEPSTLPLGEVVLVEDSGIRKWACLKCPGGCGQPISLSLNPTRRPRWAFQSDFWTRPSISPSVHQQNACGCHFWIRGGRIDWCRDGRPRPRVTTTVDAGRF